ncbi:MAG: hypothetical protein JOY62_00355 [Acidobacteriaceae bacterium]|nr:hypothetical protein [Acidobacteriaceae bacterium]MBV9778395.1 hypothetical protein [Acidobacteriaceae bacterium]
MAAPFLADVFFDEPAVRFLELLPDPPALLAAFFELGLLAFAARLPRASFSAAVSALTSLLKLLFCPPAVSS